MEQGHPNHGRSLQWRVRIDMLLVLVRKKRCLHFRGLVPLSGASGRASVMARYWSRPTKLSLSLTHTQSMTVDKSRHGAPTIPSLILHHSVIIIPFSVVSKRNFHYNRCSRPTLTSPISHKPSVNKVHCSKIAFRPMCKVSRAEILHDSFVIQAQSCVDNQPNTLRPCDQ